MSSLERPPLIQAVMPYFDVDELRRAAMGGWGEILSSAGIPAAVLDGRNHPCPKCGGRDRFAAFRDLPQRGAVHCRRCFTRGSAIRPGDGIATLRWWLGCSFAESLAFLADAVGVRPTVGSLRSRTAAAPSSCSTGSIPIDQSAEAIDAHTTFARDAHRRIDAATRRRLAEQLTVSEHALQRLRVGVTTDGNSSTWPMRNEHDQVIGVRISGLPWTQKRNSKWSRRGSQSGIFVARRTAGPSTATETQETLYITEGASDTAAAITSGLWAIGRASCSASTFFVDRYIHRHQPRRLAIIADNDDAGRSGAKRLAKSLCQALPRSLSEVDVIAPPAPANDLRAWAATSAINLADATAIATIRPKTQKTFRF
ncbi:primase-helicase zinc-binding domain-containing protein [Rhodopirellula sp. JC639]|uniref:primase-helicase zinc-binding domain-containing protein n=1 Tax=Stieleria mannarensis TaxID=2755585 RepID=UPI0016025469|nr:primase-helicase zinc-binding domain-containing protein [Rhodopirellula sp. JC639]